MPITTPETDKQFRMYGSSLEVKEAAKGSVALLGTALEHGDALDDNLRAELTAVIETVKHLLDSASDAVSKLRPTKIEDRGYSIADRGMGGFSKCGGGGCGDGCGGGSGGGCGGCGGSGGCGNP